MITKVKAVQATGTWDSQHGTLYKFLYTFEDEVTLTANHKTPEGFFKIGSEVEYEVKNEHPEHGKSGTVKKPEQAQQAYSKPQCNDDGRSLMIVRQNALGHATELLKHNAMIKNEGFNSETVIQLASKYQQWVMSPENNQTS